MSSAQGQRLVLLGASNIALGFPTIVETTRQLWQGPLHILAAFGHGRSYGMRMAVLWRELPGIIECGLWNALAQTPPVPMAALLTDVGNDLLYGVSVADIAAWVETCLQRLRHLGARVALTSLPMGSITALSPRRFLLLRSIIFPHCQLAYNTVLDQAHALDQHLRQLAIRYDARLQEPATAWYGLDPIHIRRLRRRQAWRQLLSGLADSPVFRPSRPLSPHRRLALHLLAPEVRWLFGRERHTPQPAAHFADGSTIALY